VTHDATADEMKRAYRKVSLASHPDKPGGSEEAFSRVSAAYKVLGSRTPTRSPTCEPAPHTRYLNCVLPSPPTAKPEPRRLNL
jgi:hypothetical protein